GGFGRDRTGRPGLASLLKKLDELSGDFWLRVMYLHPASVNDELLSVLKDAKHVIRCIEMPIQHIADNVLKGMGRKVFGARTREVIRQVMDLGYAVRTTLMTGFPGETREDHEELLQFVKDTKFERLGVFAYSPEPGTRAAAMEGQVPAKTASARRAALLKAQRAVSLAHNRALIGTELPVIVDEITGRGKARGRTLFDAPDIDNLVNLRFKGKLAPGAVVTAKVDGASEYELNATLVAEDAKA
ncbi:MAG: radical SAM protein, partial [Lentisphaeria bacterium]|nr:radical SAM protein [Lentisphaeria bacterium]